MLRCVATALAALSIALPLAAQTSRPFPATALRGTLAVVQPPDVAIDGRPARLSPGARIRDQHNLLVLSGSIVGAQFLVHYTLEPHGLVHDVWILNAAEAARRPWPTTPEQARAWSFDADAQAWTPR
jgi:hypothetical protein